MSYEKGNIISKIIVPNEKDNNKNLNFIIIGGGCLF